MTDILPIAIAARGLLTFECYWRVTYRDGQVFTNRNRVRLKDLDPTKFAQFAIVNAGGYVVWSTQEFVFAWRRRGRIAEGARGGHLTGCHIVELANRVVFVFEGTGEIRELPALVAEGAPGADWWNTP